MAKDLVVACSTPDGSAPKCQYVCDAGFIYNTGNDACEGSGGCMGSIPAFASGCQGDFNNVPTGVDNQTKLVNQGDCSDPQDAVWCEIECKPGYQVNPAGDACERSGPDPRPPGVPWCHKAETEADCQKLNTQFAKEVDGIGTLCKWCPKPNNEAPGRGYLYSFYRTGGARTEGRTHACVDTMNDPLNCGGCGFIESGNDIISSNNQGFCDWRTPYCVAGRCKNMADALASCTNEVYTIQAGTRTNQLLVPEGDSYFEFLDPLYNQDGSERADGPGGGTFIGRRNRLASALACAQEVKITEYTSEGRFSLYTQWPVPAGNPATGTRDLIIDSNNLLGQIQRPDQVIGGFSLDDLLNVRGLNSFYSYYGVHGWRPVSKPYILRLTPNTSNSLDNTTYGRVRIETTSGECIPGMFRSVSPNAEGKWGSEYCGADGTWGPYTPFGREIEPIFTLQQINSDPDICTQVGGTDFNERLGCCGDAKCKENSGYACHVQGICDGTNWHDARDTNTYGEIFSSGLCEPEELDYLIANVEGEFAKCVDYELDLFNRYARAHRECIPNYAVNYTDIFWGWDGFDGPNEDERRAIDVGLAGGTIYICGAGMYGVSGHRGLVEAHGNHCVGHPTYARYVENAEAWGGITYVCDIHHLDDAFAYAALLDAEQSAFHAEDSVVPYEYCPASIDRWLEDEPGYPKREYVAMVPCPGKITISENIDLKHTFIKGGVRSWSISVGGTQTRPTVSECAAPRYDGEFLPTYKLERTMYYPSNGSVMGSVANHSYLCYRNAQRTTDTKADIAVCCGSDGCANIPGALGNRGVSAGMSVETPDGRRIYCLNNGSWSMDLDFNYTQDICQQAYLFPTGNYCCAEGDDTSTWINESYNDLGGPGACFKGTRQLNEDLLTYNNVQYNDVVVFNGTFRGCGFNNSLFHLSPEFEAGPNRCVPDTNGSLGPVCLQTIEDWPNPGANFTALSPFRTNQSVIRAADQCTILPISSGVYCSFNNTWELTNGLNLSHKCIVPDDLLAYMRAQAGGENLTGEWCCEPDQCWDPLDSGGRCIEEQLDPSLYYLLNESAAYKCLQGAWINVRATGTRTPDGCFAGICPQDSQCFYNPAGDPADNNNVSEGANPQCIDDGQYIGDVVCEAGNWTTRTRKLAGVLAGLVDFATDDFVMMCGPPEKVLNYEPRPWFTNNFCVMNLNDQRIIGVTLNKPVYDPSNNTDFRAALEQRFLMAYRYEGVNFTFDPTCSQSADTFLKCADISFNNRDYLHLYYNDEYELVVLSNENIYALNGGVGALICAALPDWLKWLCPVPTPLEQSLNDVRLFNMTYGAKLGANQWVFGVAEQLCDPITRDRDMIYSFNYSGFSARDLSYITSQIKADEVNITRDQRHIFIKNPKKEDAWAALTLLRNTAQE